MTKKKSAKKRVAKKKDPKKSKAALAKAKNDANRKNAKTKDREPRSRPGTMIKELLLERKYTDEEIFAKVDKVFPGKTKQTYCNNWRHWINKLSGMTSTEKNPVERFYKVDGKLVKKSAMPKPERKAKKKYTKDNDPLKKIAGINVHGKKKTATKKPAVKETAVKKIAVKKKPADKKRTLKK